MRLEVKPLTGGVGGQQDAQRVASRIGVEPPLDLLAVRATGEAVDHRNPRVSTVAAVNGVLQDLLQKPAGTYAILGEDQHPAIIPARRRTRDRHSKDGQIGAQVGANPVDKIACLGIRLRPVARSDVRHLVEQHTLLRPQGGCLSGARSSRFAGHRDRHNINRFSIFLRVRIPRAALVVRIDRVQERRGKVCGSRARFSGSSILAIPLTFYSRAVHGERARKRLDRGEQTLLQPDGQESCSCLRAPGGSCKACFAHAAVRVKQSRQHQFRGIISEIVERNAYDHAAWELAADGTNIFLEPPHHDLIQCVLACGHATREAHRVEQLK